MSSHPTALTTRGSKTASLPAPGIPYYTPAQTPPAGTPIPASSDDAAAFPTLFTPITIRGLTLPNRFVVSPMCMYSADDGHLTDFHLVHLGQFALHGAALTIVEATSVTPEGRISPEDSGLWQDSQIAPLKRIADFVHSQGQKLGIQLGHAGRKATQAAPWHMVVRGEHLIAGPDQGGWPDATVAPSAVPYGPKWPVPLAMTKADIAALVESFAAAAKRAIAAGLDLIELHAAHGYLLHQFLSPATNKRTDEYGGSFENRVRLLAEVAAAVRAVIPAATPLAVRLSATDWLEEVASEPASWTVEESTRLAALLPGWGVDVLDVSSGGNSHDQQIKIHPNFQADLAAAIKKGLRAQGSPAADTLKIATVGMIATAEHARDVTQAGGAVEADLVLAARNFLREPEFVLRAAHQLGVPAKWAHQYSRALWPKDAKI